jgi:hypothetical protein
MRTFGGSITLGMKGRCGKVVDLEPLAEFTGEAINKLLSSVRNPGTRHTE